MLIQTSSAEETRNLGEKLGKILIPGDIVLLYGTLGAGKTTLTQGIACGLDVPDDAYVRSPTFTLINEYFGRHPVYHIDLYRIDSPEEIEPLGLEELFYGKGITIVEWAGKLFTPKNDNYPVDYDLNERVEIRMKIMEGDIRNIEIKPFNLEKDRAKDFTLQ